ncbi:IQ motif and SEC7 domain-containing protein 1-like [Oppia nitens]|uniref:IQ motif and SEC7 domain-containing protein 1-like n=1 Tax=Oppia nitens TaxID=1686743 RepID=UPI0023DACC62|nr:IQ motif and SEC7 domain-containing protein 1-like [Oppia nitens]
MTSSTKSSQSSGVCEHNSLIRRQFVKIESLENQISLLRLERDSLLDENERLHFQLQCLSETKDQRHETKRGSSLDSRSADAVFVSSRVSSDAFSRRFEAHVARTSTSSQTTLSSQSHVNHDNHYELSQQLIDRRVDALERKYGGLVARESAIRIQRAFRTYRLQKRFKSIAIQALRQTPQKTSSSETSSDRRNDRRLADQRRDTSQSDTQSTRSDDSSGATNATVFLPESLLAAASTTPTSQQFECERKRSYRVGLNLFNKNPPERGLQYLISNGFIDSVVSDDEQSTVISRFLLTRKGLSKAMIGEFLSSPASTNRLVLSAFVREIDLTGLSVDTALRKFQTFFRFPGEAQKIERMVDAFADRFSVCNPTSWSRDSVFILAFAVIMLNTDLHSPTNARHRMTAAQWLQNLRGVFGDDNAPDQDQLLQVYQRIKAQELRTGADHVTQVLKVQSALVGSRGQSVPNLCVEWRRLVCYCRLYEVKDVNKREPKDRHQRELFLFNDLLLVTKLTPKAKQQNHLPEYQFRSTLALDQLIVQLFSTQYHRFGIHLRRRLDNGAILSSFNARNELDQKRFADDLRESIAETREMDAIRIHKSTSLLQLKEAPLPTPSPAPAPALARRKSSSGSLDSGLSLPSRDHSPQTQTSGSSAPKT